MCSPKSIERKKNYRTVKLYRGCSLHEKKCIITKEFPNLTWWSTDIRDAGHYYEGCCIGITVLIYENDRMDYLRNINDYPSNYTFGSAEMECPKGSTWYSCSSKYLKDNILEIAEVQPEFYEDDKDDGDDINDINKNNI